MRNVWGTIRTIWDNITTAPKSAPARQPNPLLDGEWGDFRNHVKTNLHTKEDAEAAIIVLHTAREEIRVEREAIFDSFMEGGKAGEDFFEFTRDMSWQMKDLDSRKGYIEEKFGLLKKLSPMAEAKISAP